MGLKPRDAGNVGTLTGTESIIVDDGTDVALKTTPADITAYVQANTTPADIGAATSAQGLLADTALQPGDQVAVGTVSTFYLDAGTTIADNQFLSPSPSNRPQEADSAAVASGTNGGIGFLERFVSGPLGVTSIPAGTWSFHNYCYATNLTGSNKIITRINRRVEQVGMTGTFTGAGLTRTFTVTGGTPFIAGDANASILLASLIETPTQTAWISGFTSSSVVTVTLTDAGFVNTTDVPLNAIYYLIFNTQAATPDITSTSITTPQHADFEIVIATPTVVTPTDRIVAAYFAFTDQVASRTIALLHGGSANYSRIDSPLLGNLITQTITNGVTNKAPSEDAVFDALALKQDKQAIHTMGSQSANFDIDPANGKLHTVTMGASIQMGIMAPADTTKVSEIQVYILAASTYTLTLKAAGTGGLADVKSAGGSASSGDVLFQSGAGTYGLFEFGWRGSYWGLNNILPDEKA